MSIIKVNLPFLYSSMKNNHKDSADFEVQNCATFDLQYKIEPNT